ncbi:phage tail sheath family protein [Ureibacillus sp. FSL K6-2830]|uniref:phage tail sheath family protein n=1 Tax=Ureibacillus sp. FSL K6-2830 TaxID=2954610 RepID=UPI0030F68F07
MFYHGSRTKESRPSVTVSTEATAALPVYFGTAPVNLADEKNVNKVVLAYTYDDAVKAFGYSDDWEKYTLCEVIDAAFDKFKVAPILLVNVLDPEKHKTSKSEDLTVKDGQAKIDTEGVILSSLNITANATQLEQGKDYVASFDDEGKVIIALITNTEATTLSATFNVLDTSLVTEADIIGGTDVDTGVVTGFELLNHVFPQYRMVPGLIVAPGFSQNPTIAAVMRSKATTVNTYFKAFAITDANTTEAPKYTDVSNWKLENSYTSSFEAIAWPMAAYNNKVYHISTLVALSISKIAAENGGYPYESPSNKTLPINKAVVKAGAGKYQEVIIPPDVANELNNQGILTILNFVGGWVAWGNMTAAYPEEDHLDVPNRFIPTRIMHNWICNTIVLTTWSDVDGPIRRRIIDNVLDKMNIWINSLVTNEVILGGRIVFLAEDNPIEQLENGKVVFRYYVAESSPAQEIENIIEFDATYYNALFAS